MRPRRKVKKEQGPRPRRTSAHQTPIAHKSVTQSYSLRKTRDMKEDYKKIALDTKGHYLVGLDPQKFLENFLPWNDSTPDAYRARHPSKNRLNNLRSIVPKPGHKESTMYGPFVS
jgi:hypothetical protein